MAPTDRPGSPVELANRGFVVNHKRTEQLTRIHDIVGHTPKKRRITTIPGEGHRIPDRVQHDFTPEALDVTWCGDISYIHTWEGFLYLGFVEDLASWRILGVSMANQMRAELVADTLTEAVGTRGGKVTGVVFHSDRGTQPRFKGTSQHCLVGVSVGDRSGLRRVSSSRGSSEADC
jgi:transposase InsO family protein